MATSNLLIDAMEKAMARLGLNKSEYARRLKISRQLLQHILGGGGVGAETMRKLQLRGGFDRRAS